MSLALACGEVHDERTIGDDDNDDYDDEFHHQTHDAYIYVYMYGSRLWLKPCVVVLSCAFSCSVLHWAMAHGSDDDIIMGNRDGSSGDSSEDATMGNLEVAAARPKRVRARKAVETIGFLCVLFQQLLATYVFLVSWHPKHLQCLVPL